MNIGNLCGKKVAFAASGGLDSCTITHWMRSKGVEVVCLTANLGQPDEESFDDIRARMIKSGASEFIQIDLEKEMAEIGLEVIQANAKYEGNYWNMTGAARQVIVKGIVPILKEQGIQIFSHGATGRGNDQIRFQVIAAMLNPELSFYAAWRDPLFLEQFGGRKDMIDYCTKNKIPIKVSKDKPYSTDANLLGLTHEGGALESLQTKMTYITPGMGVWPIDAPMEPDLLTIRFVQGRPIAINGSTMSLLEIFQYLNRFCGRHGIGIAENLVENRFVGTKSRGVYESPAMVMLDYCYQQLLQQILDKKALQFYLSSASFLGTQLYQGYWIDTGSRMARKAMTEITHMVTGEITTELYKGNLSYISSNEVTYGLFTNAGSMEDEGSFDHKDSEGLLNILTQSVRTCSVQVQNKNI